MPSEIEKIEKENLERYGLLVLMQAQEHWRIIFSFYQWVIKKQYST